jgi:hypothetical protein
VAAINGDYFRVGQHGPEGLTIRNGERLDRLVSMERSALALGPAPLDPAGAALPIRAEIVRLAQAAGTLDPAAFHNAVGGGPQIVLDGKWTWARGWPHPHFRGCRQFVWPDDVINGECLPDSGDWLEPLTPWTAVGLTPDHKMIWVVGPVERIVSTLRAFGVTDAIKLDSGGSSQLWYHRSIVAGYRPVANALAVFYLRSAALVEAPRWTVAVAGTPVLTRLKLENTGADTWEKDAVGLASMKNGGLAAERVSLGSDVPPGTTVVVPVTAGPFETCGARHLRWKLSAGDQPFPGETISLGYVVLPADMADQRQAWQANLDQLAASSATDADILRHLQARLPRDCQGP